MIRAWLLAGLAAIALAAPALAQAREDPFERRFYDQGIALYLPLPGLLVLEYEHFVDWWDVPREFAVGGAIGFGWESTSGLSVQTKRLYPDIVEWPTNDLTFTIFARGYWGERTDRLRPGATGKFSLFLLDPGADWSDFYAFPALEALGFVAHERGRYYGQIGLGVKAFLRHQAVQFDGQTTFFPEFRFDGKAGPGTRVLPAVDVWFGVRFE